MKRFIDSDWYNQDWFLNLNPTYRDFWFFIFTSCDCAGIWAPSVTRYQLLSGVKINFKDFIKQINFEKERIIKLKNGNYFIKNFIPFQYTKSKLRLDTIKNSAHLGVYRCLIQNQVDINLIEPKIEIITQISKRPLKDALETSTRHRKEESMGYKDKDEDKDSDKDEDRDSDKENNYGQQLDDFLKEGEKKTEPHKWDGVAQTLFGMNFRECDSDQQDTVREHFEGDKVPF